MPQLDEPLLPHSSSHPSIYLPPLSLSLHLEKGGIPSHVFSGSFASQEPRPASLIKHSSSVLCLRDHYCQTSDWPQHNDGCVVLLFQGFLLYLCIIYHYATALFKKEAWKHPLFFFPLLPLFADHWEFCSWTDSLGTLVIRVFFSFFCPFLWTAWDCRLGANRVVTVCDAEKGEAGLRIDMLIYDFYLHAEPSEVTRCCCCLILI